jgi:hypothetical protein
MKTRIVIYLAIVTIMLTVISVFVYLQQDHTAPEIDVPAGDITYVAGQDDDAVLLQGVKDWMSSDKMRFRWLYKYRHFPPVHILYLFRE